MITHSLSAEDVIFHTLPSSPGIYQIRCKVSNTIYVGGTKNIKKRFKEHMSALRNKTHHNTHLQRSYMKYGKNAFEYCVLEECCATDVFNIEQHHLDHIFYNNIPRYNTDKTAKGDMSYATKQTRKKLSICNKHKIVSTEQREKISKTLTGRKRSAAACKKQRKSIIQTISEPFILVDCNGIHHNGLCIKDFADEHHTKCGSHTSGLYAVLSGKRRYYKGWHLPTTKFPVIFNQFLNKREIVWHINNFCRQYKLDPTGVIHLLKGRWKQYKGWVLTNEMC
jgi:group I intron endonuclease